MARAAVVMTLVLCAAGCRSDGGGLLYRKPDRADDPMYSIAEQQRRGRERYGLMDTQDNLAPTPYPSVTGH